MSDEAIIIAGDSNPLGYLNNGPAPYTPTVQVQIWTLQPDGSYNWNYMNPGVNTGTPGNPQAWGDEVALANKWLAIHQGQPDFLWIVKDDLTVKGSTTAAVEWNPASGAMFASTTRAVTDAMANLAGGPHQILHFDEALIGLGENDAANHAYAQAYLANIQAINSAARSAWHVDNLVEYRITTGAGTADDNLTVRQAQWQADQVDDQLHTFKTIGFEMQPDGVHYDAVGHGQVGAAYWDNGWLV